jgi:hypothetical protein
MPVRKAGNRAIPSLKLGRMVHYESRIERAYIYLLEYDRAVKFYEEQPCTITYWYNQQKHYYTPDFLVHWIYDTRLPTLVECKPHTKLQETENRLKWTAARLWCTRHKYEFAVVTDTLLSENRILLDNLEMLMSHAHQAFTPQFQLHILTQLKEAGGKLSVADLASRSTTANLAALDVKSCIWQLLFQGRLEADLTKPVNFTTPVSLPGFPVEGG